MGIADVIPGVSGGTMALILGIYGHFIDAVKSINPRPILSGGRWLFSGLAADRREEFFTDLRSIHWRFLIPLAIGVFLAMGAGSLIIPKLMEDYPEIMRGLFFGLILASVRVPWRMLPREGRKIGFMLAVVFLILGYVATDPNRNLESATEMHGVAASADEGETLKDILRRGPSAATSADVYWAQENEQLRQSHKESDPGAFALLAEETKSLSSAKNDHHAAKERSKSYDDIIVPKGCEVFMPRPAPWFIFVAGLVAICAMVLPGISGSFILLILGSYYFVLNALKGAISSLVRLNPAADPWMYAALFAAGCAIGLTSFSRVLAYLLRKFPSATLGALTGLMIGCLRGVWPWRHVASQTGVTTNSLPETFDQSAIAPIVALTLGALGSLALEILGARQSKKV